jgi:transposase
LLAVSTGHAATLVVTAGQNIDRLTGEASFAALCGASPIPVSSGRTDRHRLNYGGDRDANRALHMIVVCRLRYCERTRAYAQRRSAQGKTKTEIIRCLKRYIAREIYHTLNADLHPKTSPPTHRPTVSIACGAGPIGTSRRAP